MPRIPPIDPAMASPATQQMLDGVERTLGMVPNMIATMAQSAAVARAYLDFVQALSEGVITPRLRQQIALAVGQANRCNYCLAADSAIGSSIGLSEDELRDARWATSPDRKTEAALRFARRIVDSRGLVSDGDLNEIRNAGYGDAEIVEITGHVALNEFANYFNHVARPDVDFPAVYDLAGS